MRRLGISAATLAAALIASGLWTPGISAPSDVASHRLTPIDTIEADPTSPDCLELYPDVAASSQALKDNGSTINLNVRVLLDDISGARGQQVMADAARTFGPLKIKVVPTYEMVTFSGTSADGILKQARDRFGGVRPSTADIVHVLTNKDLVDLAGSSVPAGSADCVGGIKNPGYGFSVSEAYGLENFRIGPVTAYYKAESKIAAHEIAHLLGGQHHLANCVEGVPSELEAPEVSPCTLMFNTVELASFNLSAVNGAMVRAYANVYARP